MRKSLLLVSVVIGVLASTPMAGQQPAASSGYLWKQCDEDALGFRVEPTALHVDVAEGFELLIEDGMARVLMAVQDCPTYWLDGEEIGPTQEVHLWVAVDGAADVRPVPGAQRTLPTMTWFALFTGSTNPASRGRWVASGTQSLPIEGLRMDPITSPRSGDLVISSSERYSWTATPGDPFARLVAVNHDVFARTPDDEITYNRIQCLGNVHAWNSEATITIETDDDASPIGSGKYPGYVHSFLPLWCRASLADDPPTSAR